MSTAHRFAIAFVILICAVHSVARAAAANTGVRETARSGYISISKSLMGVDTVPNNTRTVTFTIYWSIAEDNDEVEEVEYSLTCSGAATCTSQSGSFMMSKTNPSDEVTVTYTTGVSGVGSVALTALAASGSEAESEIVIQLPAPLPTGAPIVGIDVVQRLPRAECLMTSAGPAGAFQCGDLVVAHAMPAYKTMNEDRRLTLLYNSAAATVQQYLPLHVTIPSGMQVPDTVRVALWIGTQEWTFKYSGSSFGSGEKRRLSLAFDASNTASGTGLYSYKLRVSNYYGTTAFHADTTQGEIVIVDGKRATDAPYGIGWSVAGVSRLYTGQSARKALLIVEADGSFVTYDSIAPATYRAVNRAFRDTIVLGTFDPGDGSATYYRQRDIDQTESYYDAAGRLRWVVDKRGQEAEYDYSSANPNALSSINVAPWPVGAPYAFSYTTAGKLQWITDPAGRTLGVTINATTGFLTALSDPGLTQAVSIGYSTVGLLEPMDVAAGTYISVSISYGPRAAEVVIST
jgi:YD repeat-containing protein